MKCWRFCKGQFVPRSIKWGRCFEIGSDKDIVEVIRKQKYKVICINDSDTSVDFEAWQRELVSACEAILPEKSEFELTQ